MRHYSWGTRIATLVFITACTTVPGQRGVQSPSRADVLTGKELSTIAGAQTAYSAVERLRPQFLVARPGSETLRGAAPRIQVFVNGNPAGDIEVLRSIRLSSVESIRRVIATTAFTQLGAIGAGDGVLLVQIR